MTYPDKLLDPRWQKKKAEILTRDNYTCRSCGTTDITLHAHHIKYIEDIEPWDYADKLLITYCEICHNTQHLIGNTIQSYLIDLIKNNPPMIHLSAQMCVLAEKKADFNGKLRVFLKKEIEDYYESNRVNK
jgi:hypothetical protein